VGKKKEASPSDQARIVRNWRKKMRAQLLKSIFLDFYNELAQEKLKSCDSEKVFC
jgi:hypothetical protein